jgi:hypothetical protein
MAQQDPNALTDGAKRLEQGFEDFFSKVPTPEKKPDTTWHDKMVKEANDSFAKKDQKKAPQKKMPRKR